MTAPPALVVVDPGLFATLQDRGRVGYRRFGVSEAGAMDPAALRLANRLVGNAIEEAAVEFTLIGGVYECQAESCRVAITGALTPITLNGSPAPQYTALRLRAGDRLTLARARAGLRGYLAVEGGFDLPPVLGSLSTHVRSSLGGLEGRALAPGDRLPLRLAASSSGPCLALEERRWPGFKGPIRIVFGPQDDCFTAAAREQLIADPFIVSSRSDRMACRLEGGAIAHAGDFNIVSDGIANGSIQIAGSGSPIVLLADRQTTGGYPKIATVIAADTRLLGQRRPGETVRFCAVTPEQAEAAWRASETELRSLDGRLHPVREAPDLSSTTLLSQNLISGAIGEF